MFDAVIIGGGPAGSTAGRLLADWGYQVVIVNRQSRRPSLAETLPPSTSRLFRLIGIHDQIERAGFYPANGVTSWWGSEQPRAEQYPESGYQVIRTGFDSVLLDLARQAGAMVRDGSVEHVQLPEPALVRLRSGESLGAKFVLDASGRTGAIATQGPRIGEPRHRTIAICGVWINVEPVADPSHTLIESYEDGWTWSVPVSPTRRFVTTMINTRETQTVRGDGLLATYTAELAKTRASRHMLVGSQLERHPWACDASLYRARSYSGPQHLLIGDAGSFVDPLSSFGVRKAMSSAWLGAVVVNTCLRRPEMARIALEYFDEREHQVYADHLRQTAALFREVARKEAHPFWTARSEARAESEFYTETELTSALDELKRSPSIHLQRTAFVRTAQAPRVRDREIVLEEILVLDSLPPGLEYMRGVDLPKLVEISGGATQIPELFETYNRVCAPVALPNFLSALALLIAKQVLQNVGSG
ncbi:MAG: flavin-dependent monooxygenase QhpG [Bryobacteraceae bacterium]